MKKDDLKLRIENLIEKYRFWIGGGLLVLILTGSGVLLWRENYSKPSLESRITNYESRISQLEAEQKSEALNPKSETNQNVQNSNDQNGAQEQGQVAGATAQEQKIPDQVRNDNSEVGNNKVMGKINLNTATLAELDSLSGIGPTYAQRIIDYRNEHSGFKNIEEVKNVKGIGDKTFEKFKDKISI